MSTSKKLNYKDDEYPSTRQEGRDSGYKLYFTGKLCVNNHKSPRRVSNGSCLECEKESSREWYKNNTQRALSNQKNSREKHPETYKNNSKKWRENNPERVKKRNKDWKDENKDHVKNYMIKWREENRDHIKEYEKKYYELNKGRVHSWNAERKSNKKRATPSWVDKVEIEYIYSLASEKGLEVDHIVPLNSDYVCGLHCADNLRCIPKKLNYFKSNRYWPDMPEELRPNLEQAIGDFDG